MNSAAEWVASIPERVTPREALVYIETALRDAKEATDAIVNQYTGGTLPPPPWPQHPALESAIARMEGGRLMMNQAIALGYGDEKQPKSGANGARLLTAGQSLYREIAAMQKQDRESKTTLPQLAARAAAAAAGTQLGGLAFVALLLWAAHRFGADD